jgi:hypothetical protein
VGQEMKMLLYVEKLAFIYTLAGAKILDVSANVDVVKHAVKGIDLAFQLSPKLGVDIGIRPFIMAKYRDAWRSPCKKILY